MFSTIGRNYLAPVFSYLGHSVEFFTRLLVPEAETLESRAHKGFESVFGPEYTRAAGQLSLRKLKDEKFNHNLFHMGMRMTSTNELENLRENLRSFFIADLIDSDSPDSDPFTNLHALDRRR